jgi:hypothetical protein
MNERLVCLGVLGALGTLGQKMSEVVVASLAILELALFRLPIALGSTRVLLCCSVDELSSREFDAKRDDYTA